MVREHIDRYDADVSITAVYTVRASTDERAKRMAREHAEKEFCRGVTEMWAMQERGYIDGFWKVIVLIRQSGKGNLGELGIVQKIERSRKKWKPVTTKDIRPQMRTIEIPEEAKQ